MRLLRAQASYDDRETFFAGCVGRAESMSAGCRVNDAVGGGMKYMLSVMPAFVPPSVQKSRRCMIRQMDDGERKSASKLERGGNRGEISAAGIPLPFSQSPHR